MDKTMLERWQAGTKPFDGVTLYLDDLVPIAQLCSALVMIVDSLKEAYPDASLRAYEDWHEHDGYVVSSDETEWDEVDHVLISDQTLKAPRIPRQPLKPSDKKLQSFVASDFFQRGGSRRLHQSRLVA